jgi:hypothetical protein
LQQFTIEWQKAAAQLLPRHNSSELACILRALNFERSRTASVSEDVVRLDEEAAMDCLKGFSAVDGI